MNNNNRQTCTPSHHTLYIIQGNHNRKIMIFNTVEDTLRKVAEG